MCVIPMSVSIVIPLGSNKGSVNFASSQPFNDEDTAMLYKAHLRPRNNISTILCIVIVSYCLD